MNKRKSLSYCNSKKSKKKKSLFINTNDYRDKKQPSFGDVSFNISNYDICTSSSKGPKESTPVHNTVKSKEVVPKLAVQRRRSKARHLSFSNVPEKLEHNKKENGSSKSNDYVQRVESNSAENVNTVADATDLSHISRINESDLISAETVASDILDDNRSVNIVEGKPLRYVSVEKAADHRIDTSPDKSSLNSNTTYVTTLKDTLNHKDDLHDESLLNCLLSLNSSTYISIPNHAFGIIPKDDVLLTGDALLAKNEGLNRNHEPRSTKDERIVIKNDPLFTKVDAIVSKDDSTFTKDDAIFANINVTGVGKTETFYGLPMKTKDMFIKHRNISELYDWQDECLRLEAIDKRQNLIYSLPTSSGKTLVAEILMLKELLVQEKNAILVLPYVSIVQEKVRGLSPFAVDLNFHIEEYASSKGPIPPKKRRTKKSIFIATIEKANAIINSLIEKERCDELGLLVVDELHMVGEGGGRGSLLEILLTKIMFKFPAVQLIGMSATLGNMEEMQKFLNAEVYTNNFRPVNLTEYIKSEDSLFVIDPKAKCEEDLLKLSRNIAHPKGLNPALAAKDPDHIMSLVLEVIPNYSCLVFCATKKNCENVSTMIARSLPKKLQETRKEEKRALLEVIQKAINGICSVLMETIPYGIAYHHSGLTIDEREIIEDAYRSGVLSVLCCTSTLASGVNLPARRVILRSPYVGKSFLSRSRYQQMVGRAGRAGIETTGESILIIQKKDTAKSRSLLSGPIVNCQSSLFYEEGKGLRQLILSLLGLKICSSESEIETFLQLTLFYIQRSSAGDYKEKEYIRKEVLQLTQLGLVANNTSKDGVCILRTTNLGNATLKACVNIDLAPFVYNQLKKATEALVLVNELHLLYLVTPLDPISDVHVDWMIYYKLVNKLTEVEVKACGYIGITPDVLCRKATGQRVPKANYDDFVYKRFYLTLMIHEMLKSKGFWDVVYMFNESRGFLQSLFSSATTFALKMVCFTEELSEMWMFKVLFQTLCDRITKSKYSELAVLMEIPGVKQGRAMQLFKGGYRTLQHLTHVHPATLTREIEHLNRRQAELIVSSAKMILQEKVEALRDEANEMEVIPG